MWYKMDNRTSRWNAVVRQTSFNETDFLLECTIDVINVFATLYGSSSFGFGKRCVLCHHLCHVCWILT
jgi:hypothetical protein